MYKPKELKLNSLTVEMKVFSSFFSIKCCFYKIKNLCSGDSSYNCSKCSQSHEKLNCHEFWVTLRVMVSLQHIKHKKQNQCSCWRRFLNPHPRQTFVPGFLIIIIYLFFFCNPTVSQQGFRFEYAKAYLRSSVYYSFFDTMFEEQQEIEAPWIPLTHW